MRLNTRFFKDIAVLSINGKININSSKLIETVGILLKKRRVRIIIDMKNVSFIDYNGLSVLAIAYKNALNNKCEIKLCNIPVHVRELLRIVKLDDVFDTYKNIKEALESFDYKADLKREISAEKPLRRRFMRLDLDAPVTYRLAQHPRRSADDSLYSGRLANLSGAGLFMRCIQMLPPGSEVLLEIPLEKGRKPKQLQGIVMWLADETLQPGLYPGMGIAFTGLSPYAQENIIEYIEKHTAHPKG